MYLEKYDLSVSPNYIRFAFISEGKNGKIKKGIIFSQTDNPQIWNLGFGDVDSITQQISDVSISDNGDSEKVLATVAQSVILFTERNSSIFVYAKGSSLSRTRLYRIGISKHYEEILEYFDIWGYLNDEWHPFEKNIDYQAFLVKRKFSYI